MTTTTTTLQDLIGQMEQDFLASPHVQQAYGLDPTKTLSSQLSPLSIERILMHCYATALHATLGIISHHQQQIQEYISTMQPHTLRWYAHMATLYRHGWTLPANGSPYYTDAGQTPDSIAKAMVVAHAVATEDVEKKQIDIKAHTLSADGQPKPLKDEQLQGLRAYMDQVKDAGILISITSQAADTITLKLTLWVDPALITTDGYSTTDPSARPVEQAITTAIRQLPYDGTLYTAKLMQAVSQVPGVMSWHLAELQAQPHGKPQPHPIKGMDRPLSGYYNLDLQASTITYKPHTPTGQATT